MEINISSKVEYPYAFETHRNDKNRVRNWLDIFEPILCPIPKNTLIDCGCGTGRFTVPLSKLFKNTFGVDHDSKMLEIAQGKSSSVRWIKADVKSIPLPDSVTDVILASMLIEHLDNPYNFSREAGRLIKKNGILILRTMLPDDIRNTTWYSFSKRATLLETARTYTRAQVQDIFEISGFMLDEKLSIENIIEKCNSKILLAKLADRSYEILHHLDNTEMCTLLRNADTWAHATDTVNMSSSLLIFRMR